MPAKTRQQDAPHEQPEARRRRTDKDDGASTSAAGQSNEGVTGETAAAASAAVALPSSSAQGAASGSQADSTHGYRHTVGAYSQREDYLIQQEQEGALAFHYVVNDGTPNNMIWLVGLKNIFSKQLPNMPREYICRLIFDRRHRSVALVQRNGNVMGGITYRVFPEQALGEIAFCAVTANEQVKGFGTRLMNRTKDYARSRDNLQYFLTYADNNAVGYFLKQGFTKEISLPRDKWAGVIKDYDGGTLMEYVMQPKLPYAQLPSMVKAQKEAIDSRLRGLSNCHIVHPGLQHFVKQVPHPLEPPRSADWQLSRPVPEPMRVRDIPGVKQAGWAPDQSEQPKYRVVIREGEPAVAVTKDTLQSLMQHLLDAAVACDDSWPFREPVPAEQVPDYMDVIKDPVDLTLLQHRLDSKRYYWGLEMFHADFKRMLNNCRFYNHAETPFYRAANKLDAFIDTYLRKHVVHEEQ